MVNKRKWVSPNQFSPDCIFLGCKFCDSENLKCKLDIDTICIMDIDLRAEREEVKQSLRESRKRNLDARFFKLI